MFPPKPTQIAEEWLTGLWQSLCRGGEHLVKDPEQAFLDPLDGGRACVGFPLCERPTPEAKKACERYIHSYARAAGWKVERIHWSPRHLSLIFIKASDKSLKKPSARPVGSGTSAKP